MVAPILTTKLYIPPPRPQGVYRPHLIERLNQGLHGKLTLISAPAGFGKSTLAGEWAAASGRPVAWLSLDEEDSEPNRFLSYLIAALQTIEASIGSGLLGLLQSPQPSGEWLLTTLINEIAALPGKFILVLDDYHLIEGKAVGDALAFVIEHLPPQMHLVIVTREDPALPLARYRARGQMTELRTADLRFTPGEAAEFLNRVMGLALSPAEIADLETRTEGWIAGLQLAALALQGTLSRQGEHDAARLIHAFNGSHHFVMDYLVEEVLQRQPAAIQAFLLRTSILDRLCGPLCDAVLLDPHGRGQETLAQLEHANLFIVPLDNERRWYRYHHLFADLLRRRLRQSALDTGERVDVYHIRASQWYEETGLEVEAFNHAAAANDVDRAARLIEGGGMPAPFRGVMAPVLRWLASLPAPVLDARPSLWVIYASALAFTGRQTGVVEEVLQAAEAALQRAAPDADPDEQTLDLIGQIAAIRAMLAIPQNQVETLVAQSRRALAHLRPDNLAMRTAAIWTLGLAHQLQGDRVAARHAYGEAISLGQAAGNVISIIAATTSLGQVQEAENQLYAAAETYRRVLAAAGEPPLPSACEAALGLARVLYQWNDLAAAEQYGQLSARLAPQIESVDTPAACGLFLARLCLVRGDDAGAAALVAEAEQFLHRHNFAGQLADAAAVQVLLLLRQGKVATAAALARQHDLPLSQARVHLAGGEPATALAVLAPVRRQAEAKGWADERLKVMVLQALAHQAHGDQEAAVRLVGQALALAEPGGFVRLFVDEGPPMARLLAAAQGISPAYTARLMASFAGEPQGAAGPDPSAGPSLPEPLSRRELEVLHLIAQGLSNREIGERLFLALNTVKGHTRIIYSKLQVQRRTEAVARARQLGLL